MFNNLAENKQIDDKTKILVYAQSKYLKDGFYKIPMDSLAVEMHISKKTIYKHFPTKEKLVEEVARFTMNALAGKVDEIVSSDLDAVAKIANLFELIGTFITHVSENWLSDIKIHMPVIWEKIDTFRTKKIYSVFSTIIEQGKREKVFLDKPSEIIITIFVASVRAIVSPDFLYYNKFSYKEAMNICLEILFNGILTEKGKKLLNKFINKETK
jgi:hypothetical protein